MWINAGFFVFEPEVLSRYGGESLEEDVLPALASTGDLMTYPHQGFWRSVDTFKDLEELERVALGGTAWAGLKVVEWLRRAVRSAIDAQAAASTPAT